jgi:sensor histidine kinase YesM
MPRAGRLRLAISTTEKWLDVSVSDNGRGVPSAEVEKIFFGDGSEIHALALLRRRLESLYRDSFRLDVQSELEQGTTVTMRIPLQKGLGISQGPAEDRVADYYRLAPR